MQEVIDSLPIIGQVCRAATHRRRVFWILVALVSIFLTVLQSTIIITQYFQYPVTVTVSNTLHSYLKSPAITICPTARLSCRRLAASVLQDIKKTRDQLDEDTPQTSYNGSASIPPDNESSRKSPLHELFFVAQCCKTLKRTPVSDLYLLGCKSENGFGQPADGRLVTPHITFEQYHNWISKISFQEREKFFLQLNETVVSCRLAHTDCMGDIRRTPPSTLVSQGCFTILGDLVRKSNTDRSVPTPGASSGLTVLLRTDLKDYPSSGIAESSGFAVQLHSRLEPPNVGEFGFLVSPATVTKVAVAVSKETRMRAPYPSNCMEYWQESSFSPLVWTGESFNRSNETYTFDECLNMCYQWYLITRCGCFDIKFRINFTILHGNVTGVVYDLLPKLKHCGGPEQVCVREYVVKVYGSDDTGCPCRLECRANTFDLTLTTATFPVPTYKETFYKTYKMSESTGVAVLQVFYNTLEKQSVDEQPKYEDIAAMVSGIGGICGAFLGLSLIDFIEILEIICQAVKKIIS